MKTLSKMDVLKIKLRQTPNYKLSEEDQIVSHLACVWYLQGMEGYEGGYVSCINGILRAITGQEYV